MPTERDEEPNFPGRPREGYAPSLERWRGRAFRLEYLLQSRRAEMVQKVMELPHYREFVSLVEKQKFTPDQLNKIHMALSLAVLVHANGERKRETYPAELGGGKLPEITHPLAVAIGYLRVRGGMESDPKKLQALADGTMASLLHDTGENGEVTYDELRQFYNLHVADLVSQVTTPKLSVENFNDKPLQNYPASPLKLLQKTEQNLMRNRAQGNSDVPKKMHMRLSRTFTRSVYSPQAGFNVTKIALSTLKQPSYLGNPHRQLYFGAISFDALKAHLWEHESLDNQVAMGMLKELKTHVYTRNTHQISESDADLIKALDLSSNSETADAKQSHKYVVIQPILEQHLRQRMQGLITKIGRHDNLWNHLRAQVRVEWPASAAQ